MRDFLDLGGLALADESAWVGRLESLRNDVDDLRAGRLGQRLEFGERLVGRNFVARGEFDSNQNRAFDLFERLTAGAVQMETSAFDQADDQPSKNPPAARRQQRLAQFHRT